MTDNDTTQGNALDAIQGGNDMAASRDSSGDMMLDTAAFEHAQRVAKLMASSQLVPQHMQGKPADCFLALHMAHRLREDPLMVAQNIVIIHGQPGWRAQWLISRANRLGVFNGRIRFEEQGTPGQSDHLVTAKATLAETGEEVQARASMAMAQQEGWTKNPKYQSMPGQMLSYRAASFLVRLYAPEATLGYQSAEEVEDTNAAAGPGQRQPAPGQGQGQAQTATDALANLPPGDDPDAVPEQAQAASPPAPGSSTPGQAVTDQADQHASNELDDYGVPWDARIHSQNRTTTAQGAWRRRQGLSDEYYTAVRKELLDQQQERAAAAQEEAADPPPWTEAARSSAENQAPAGQQEDGSDGAPSSTQEAPPGMEPRGAPGPDSTGGEEGAPAGTPADAAGGNAVGAPALVPDPDQPQGADPSSYGIPDAALWQACEDQRDQAVADGDVEDIDQRIMLATGVRDGYTRRNLLQSLQTAKTQASDNLDAQE